MKIIMLVVGIPLLVLGIGAAYLATKAYNEEKRRITKWMAEQKLGKEISG